MAQYDSTNVQAAKMTARAAIIASLISVVSGFGIAAIALSSDAGEQPDLNSVVQGRFTCIKLELEGIIAAGEWVEEPDGTVEALKRGIRLAQGVRTNC